MVSESHLDDLLGSAAPRIARRTAELDQVLLEIAHEAEAQSRRPKRTSRYLVAGAAVAGIIGLGGAATAAGLIPTWTPWTGSSGASCSFLLTVDPAGSPSYESADMPRPVYDDPATVEANSFLARYDFASLDRDAAVQRFAEKLRVARAAMPAGERPPAPDVSRDDFQQQAVDDLVEDQLTAHLEAAGFDPDSVVVSGVDRCHQ